MSPRVRGSAVFGFVVLGLAVPAWGGAPIEFRLGQRQALPHSAVRGVVAEFLDVEDTRLGTPVAIVLGGELLTAVSDLPGAGVLVATDSEGTGVVRRLGGGYNRAAAAIAREQGAIAALWGSVDGTPDRFELTSNVSQVPDSALGELRVGIEWAGRPVPGFAASLPPRSYRFVPRTVAAADFFERPLAIIGPPRAVHAEPNRGAPIVGTVGPTDAVHATGLRGRWWRITLAAGRHGWLEHEENSVRVPPRMVDAPGRTVPAFDAPGGEGPRRKGEFRGTYPVLDARCTARGLWLKIHNRSQTVDAGTGAAQQTSWVHAEAFRARYSLPAVHFLAGLYRYRLGRYREAAQEFRAFAANAGALEDNVTLSVAYQLAALSSLQADPRDRKALADFDRAVSLTPFDARALALRALGAITTHMEVPKEAILDLQTAQALDPRDRTTRDLVQAMQYLLDERDPTAWDVAPLAASVREREMDVRRLHKAAETYPDSVYAPKGK